MNSANDTRRRNSGNEIASAAFVFQFFVAAYAALVVWLPPTGAQLAVSDPLIQLQWLIKGPWGVLALCLGFSAPWLALHRPNRSQLVRGAAFAAAGAAITLVAVTTIYAISGGVFPSYIPPEESAATGLTLGIGAGALEEAVFRFGLLPAAFFLLQKRMPKPAAIIVASLITGLAFALSHELGPGAGRFQVSYFATRVIIPGVGMSLVFFTTHPAFLITAHCAAHLGINLFFNIH